MCLGVFLGVLKGVFFGVLVWVFFFFAVVLGGASKCLRVLKNRPGGVGNTEVRWFVVIQKPF